MFGMQSLPCRPRRPPQGRRIRRSSGKAADRGTRTDSCVSASPGTPREGQRPPIGHSRHQGRGACAPGCRCQGVQLPRGAWEPSAGEVFGDSLDTDLRAALFLSWHKWQQAAGTPSNSSRRKPRPRRRRTGKHRRSHSAPPSTGEGRASGSFHDASGDAEDESGTGLGHIRSEGDLRGAIRQAVAEFINAGSLG